MGLKSKLLKGSLILSVGQGLGYGASFLRNMVLARLLTKSDFGVAAACGMAISMFEFAGKAALGRLVVQDKEGDQPEFIAVAHAVQCAAAFGGACLLLLAAKPLASLFGQSTQPWVIQCLALVPLLKGLEHLDVSRFGRQLRFWPQTVVDVGPQLAITGAAWPIIVLMLVKSLMSCVGSHWLAENPYRWRVDRECGKRIVAFSWPLMANSFLMFGIQQGDQMLVAGFYSLSDLGAYSAAASLTLAPGIIFAHVFSAVMLPVFARHQDNPNAFARYYLIAMHGTGAFCAVYAAVLVVGGDAWMVTVFGRKYSGAGYILAWLAAANTLRMLSVVPVLAAMAKADTKTMMYCNLLRCLRIVLALVMATSGQSLWKVAAAGAAGEATALVAAFWLLHRRAPVPWVSGLKCAAIVGLILTLSGAVAVSGVRILPPCKLLLVALCGGLFAGFVGVLAFSECRNQLIGIARALARVVLQLPRVKETLR